MNHTGPDIKIFIGQVMNRKTTAHVSLKALWGQWKDLFAINWQYTAHINALEMRMILNNFLWKVRKNTSVNKRWLHLKDNMICLYIFSKSRTSSRQLQPICNHIGSLRLALKVTTFYFYIPSDENPTDGASRQ